MNNQTRTAYINALLADAAYVDANLLATDLPKRMTPTQGDYLAANFEIASSINTSDVPLLGSGFDATVWRIKAHSALAGAGNENAGKIHVAMRGTEAFPGADLLADADLTLNAGAARQIVDMVNWWLRTTTGGVAMQIISAPPVAGAPLFVRAADVQGTGELIGVSSVSINGHSLGGHLAAAFARIFGGSVAIRDVSTFNSAGFNGIFAEPLFDDIQAVLGTGLPSYASNKQANYFGQNGVELTTNTWWFNQMGSRIGLFQEDVLAGGVDPFINHTMCKLTDLLALGAALEKLDPSMTFNKLNELVKSGSNDMKGTYEGVLDGLRHVLIASSLGPVSASYASDSPARVAYHKLLKELTVSATFTSLSAIGGKATITLATSSLSTTAKTDFAAFLSLNARSPVVVGTEGTSAITALKAANPELASVWTADKNACLFGDTTRDHDYSDNWYADRTAMLTTVVNRNQTDQNNTLTPPNAAQGLLAGRYYDLASNTDITVGTTITRQYLFGHKEQAKATKSIAACAYRTNAKGRVGFNTATNDSFMQAAA